MVGKSAESGEKRLKAAKSWKKLEKVGKSREKWGRWENVFFLNFGQNGRRRPFWMSENNFRSQFLPFQIDKQLFFFLKFLDKMAAGAAAARRRRGGGAAAARRRRGGGAAAARRRRGGGAAAARRRRGGGAAAVRRRCGGGAARRGCVADENIISPKTYVSREYNCLVVIISLVFVIFLKAAILKMAPIT